MVQDIWVVESKKLDREAVVGSALRHNKREHKAERAGAGNFDPGRSHLNYSLAGLPTSREVNEFRLRRMEAAGIGVERRVRRDAVFAVEFVFSLPPETTIDPRRFFADCVRWVASEWGGAENVLSADVHLDETAPHCHVIVVPIFDGRLNGSEHYGNRSAMSARRGRFHEQVASRYGLTSPPAKLDGKARALVSDAVFRRLRELDDPVLTSVLWPAFQAEIIRNPLPFATRFGVDLAAVSSIASRAMAATSTGQSKGPSRLPQDGPQGRKPHGQTRTLACVGFTPAETHVANFHCPDGLAADSQLSTGTASVCTTAGESAASFGLRYGAIDPDTGEIAVMSEPTSLPVLGAVGDGSEEVGEGGEREFSERKACRAVASIAPSLSPSFKGSGTHCEPNQRSSREQRRRWAYKAVTAMREPRAGPGWRPPNSTAAPATFNDTEPSQRISRIFTKGTRQ